MRKNYFAKKFVAYSMAFAVAFSTLTVSPVFVKEASAAPITIKDADLTVETVNAGDYLVEAVSSNGTGGEKSLAEFKSWANLGTINIIGTYDNGEVSINNGATAITKTSTPVGVAFNNKINKATPDDLSKESDVGNVNVKLEASKPVTWYKLSKNEKTFSNTYSNGGVTATENVKVNYYMFEEVSLDWKSGNDIVIPKVEQEQLGTYVAVDDTTDPTTHAFDKVYTITEASDLNVEANQSKVKSSVGKSAILEVETTSTRDVEYNWVRNGKSYGTKAVLTFSNLTEEDFGSYTCQVTDGIVTKSVTVTLSKAKVSDVVVNEPASPTPTNPDDDNYVTKDNATTVATAKNVLVSDNLPAQSVVLTTRVPSDANLVYVWATDLGDLTDYMSNADKYNYNASNNSLTFVDPTFNSSKTDMNGKTVTVYAVEKALYESKLDPQIKAVSSASEYDKLDKVEALINTAATSFTTSNKYVYKETFTFGNVTSNLALSDVKVAKIGDTLTLTAPEIENATKINSYSWAGAGNIAANDKTLKVNTLGINDFRPYVCTINYDVEGTPGKVATYTTYVLYQSDLSASAVTDTITTKVGSKNLELAVNANASLPIKYTWKTNGTRLSTVSEVVTGDKSKVKISSVKKDDIYEPATYKEDGTIDQPASQYHYCEVTDGIITKTVVFKINETVGFTVAEDKDDNLTETINKAVIDGRSCTLAPTVTASEGTTVTYKWYKTAIGTQVLSNDPAYTFTFDKAKEDTPVYIVEITDGSKKVTLTYNVSEFTLPRTVDMKDFKDMTENAIYTGTEQDGKLVVTYTYQTAGADTPDNANDDVYSTITLVKDKDYTVEYKENVNVGVARYAVTLIGTFKNITDKINGQFYIDRADNKLEIADKTVTLGQSVQPATVTNLSKGALTYTYYADADCTTEIDVPNKVGTYYVKATSVATANYNEATSNVATIKITGLGKTKIGSTSRTASSVKLPWTKVAGATKYRVYKKAAGASSYTKVADTTALSYNVKGLASATTYTFAVKAYGEGGWATVYATKTTTTAPAKVSTPVVTAKGSGKVAISYKKVARATGYQIYMAKGNGSYKKIAQGSKTAITKSRLAKGATYKFKVRAYKTVGSNTYYGAFSSVKAVKVK